MIAACPLAHVLACVCERAASRVQLLGVQRQRDLCAYVQVVEAFKILTSDKQVKAILVNIFGTQQLPRRDAR